MQHITIILGTPRCGISMLSQCLKILGLKTIDDQKQPNISTIHSLLFHDLGHSPTMAGPLASDWLKTPGAERAKQRINTLIADYCNETDSLFIADSNLGRFMLLWNEAFKKANLTPKFLFMLRHPWETAQALAANENMEIDNAHLLWLAHVRDSVKVFKDSRHTLITFDQLLADPVSILSHIGTELELFWANDPWSAYSSLLDFVQPALKHHHISNLPNNEKQKFKPYDNMYHKIRYGHWSQISSATNLDTRSLAEPNTSILNAKEITPAQPLPNEEPSLIENLLKVIGRYEKQDASSKTKHNKISTKYGPPLFFRVIFPSAQNDIEIVETIPLISLDWQKLSLPVPDPNLLKDKPIILKPLNTNGIIHVSAINFINKATGVPFWAVSSREDFDMLTIEGDAIRLPDQEKLLLLVTGDEPQIKVEVIGSPPDCPLELEIWVKACRELNILKEKDCFFLDKDDSLLSKLLRDEKVLNNSSFRMLKSILPKSLENSTSKEIKSLIGNKDIMLNTMEYAKQCGYKLPTFLVSFPRSGSNFLQNVLSLSTGLCCRSFYAPRPKDPQCVLSYKSHALSPMYLNDEISRYYPDMKQPDKIILLIRDPRDVMISFYDLLIVKKGIIVNQNDFLNEIDYDYAFVGDSNYVYSQLRKIEVAPLSVAEAYIRHIESWLINTENSINTLIISYEKLVESPEIYFNKIFSFLEIDAELDLGSLSIKVSQYSDESRIRAIPHGWKSNNTHGALIDQVNNRFSEYISKLGY